MLTNTSLDFLERLLNTSGPSGFEEEAAKVYRREAETFADKVYTDVMGNTMAVINPDAPFKIMLAGHYDEIGFQVVYISEEGLLYIRSVGGIDKHTIPGLDVNVLTNKGLVPGSIGRKPIHLQTPKERETASEIHDLWVDIGAENREEAAKMVAIGDPVSFKPNYRRAGENRIFSKGMDDKIGAFAVLEALRLLSVARPSSKVGVYAVGTVQEELGTRGAKTGTFGIAPNAGICVDVGFATDIPGVDKKQWGDVKLGSGPIVSRNADTNPVLLKKALAAAEKNSIPFQMACGHRATGGTDTATMQLSGAGVATCLFSIPNRYMHTPVELCDLRDVENTSRLIAETIASLTGEEQFRPGVDE